MGGGGGSPPPEPLCKNTTQGCRVRVFQHNNFGGANWGIAETSDKEHPTDNTICRKACGICLPVGGWSSLKVLDCPDNVVPVGHYQGNGYSYPMGASGPLGHSLALKGDVPAFPGGWNDNMYGISFHTVAEPNENQMKYEIVTKGINVGGSGENALPKIGIGADRDDVILGTAKDGNRATRPCPGGTGQFMQGATKVRCLYSKTDDAAMRTLYTNKNGISNDPRASMHADLKDIFCNIPDNIFKNPGGGMCLEHGEGKNIAKEYCKVGDRIRSDGNCTKDNLGNFYAELAETYCKTATGKADVWCACYNVTNNVCDTDSAAAGCDKKRQQFDKLVEATPEGFRHVWSGRAACFGGVCQGDKYVPQNANQNCNAPVQICAQSFDLSQISESSIEAQCNLSASTGTPPSAGSTPSATPSETPSETPSGDTPSGGIGDYIPRSLGDIKNDSKKQLAVGGVGGLFLSCCCLLVIILLLASSGGGGGGPTRFRR